MLTGRSGSRTFLKGGSSLGLFLWGRGKGASYIGMFEKETSTLPYFHPRADTEQQWGVGHGTKKQ